jgi:hypothetical protein
MRQWFVLCLVCWLSASQVRAETPLRVDQSGERMRVDGALREWKGARFTSVAGRGETRLRFALATADGGLYVGAEIEDDRLLRSQGAGPKQDALVLTLAMPAAAGAQVTELWLHAGEAGRSRAVAALRSGRGGLRDDARIKVVEGPRDGGAAGYVLEAFIPWAAVAGAEIWEQGRGALRYEDVDASGRAPTVVATADATSPERLPALALGDGQRDLLGAFLEAQQLTGVKPRFDLRGNVYGGALPERVAIVDKFVVVHGPEYQKGESYGFLTLPLGTGGGIKDAQLIDLTADGRAELVTTLRQRNELGAREVWMVYSLAEESPRAAFGVELRKEVAGGFVENTLSLERRAAKPPRIVVKPGRTANLAADSYRESAAADVQPIILPWSGVKARTFGHVDGSFSLIDELRVASAGTGGAPHAASTEVAPATPELEPIAPSVEALLAHFKAQQKLPRGLAPRRRQHGNLGFGPEREQLFEIDRHLVVVGPEVGQGASFLAYTLPV